MATIGPNLAEIREAAEEIGLPETYANDRNKLVQFRHKSGRITVWYGSKGTTVGTSLNHPVGGKRQLFRRNCTLEELFEIFSNPRVHTGKGYYTKGDASYKRHLDSLRANLVAEVKFAQQQKNARNDPMEAVRWRQVEIESQKLIGDLRRLEADVNHGTSESKSVHLSSGRILTPKKRQKSSPSRSAGADYLPELGERGWKTVESIRSSVNNPSQDDSWTEAARYFVIKSFVDDNVHKAIKYDVWASTVSGNKKLSKAYQQCQRDNRRLFLFFSVNGSGHFCGVAEMTSDVDYSVSQKVWNVDNKWNGSFSLRWVFIKDVPLRLFAHLGNECTRNCAQVIRSSDTQEVHVNQAAVILEVFSRNDHSNSLLLDSYSVFDERELLIAQQKENQTLVGGDFAEDEESY